MKVVHIGTLLVCGWLLGCGSGAPPAGDGPFCGGIAGIPCPGAGECRDNPADSCDPKQGGADCGGLCQCRVNGVCTTGSHWDSSPTVCSCVPDQNPCALALCPAGTQCTVQDGKASCVGGDACGKVTCGAGLQCCNASCGMCVPPGRACIQIACE